jgi:hypothetical protein
LFFCFKPRRGAHRLNANAGTLEFLRRKFDIGRLHESLDRLAERIDPGKIKTGLRPAHFEGIFKIRDHTISARQGPDRRALDACCVMGVNLFFESSIRFNRRSRLQ